MADFEAPTTEELEAFVPPTEEEAAEFAAPTKEELAEFKANPEGGVEDPMGALEAFGRQGIAAATLGASDIVGGVGAAIGQGIADVTSDTREISKQALLDAYKEGKSREADSRDKAFEDQKVASGLGMLAGGLATPIPGAMLARTGKVGATVAKALPSTKGAATIAKAGKVAKTAKELGKLDLYKKLKMAQLAKSTSLAEGRFKSWSHYWSNSRRK